MKTVKKAKTSKAAKAKAKCHAKRSMAKAEELYFTITVLAVMLSGYVRVVGEFAGITKDEYVRLSSDVLHAYKEAEKWMESRFGKSRSKKNFKRVLDDLTVRSDAIIGAMLNTLGTVSHKDFGRKAKKRT